jgi:small subunit ribosomal protein S16
MSVVIRMMRTGAKKRPAYRMVVADSRRQRDGRFLEILGHYNPLTQPHEFKVNKEKVEHWLSRGAQPSTQAASLLRSIGITPRSKTAAPRAEGKTKEKRAKGAKRHVARKPSERKTRAKATRKAAKKKAQA